MKNQNMENTPTMLMTPDQCHKQALNRSNCYGLLALIFRDTPTSETITQLRTPPLAGVLNDLGYDVTQHLAGELETVTTCLREQYTQTFVGPGPHICLYASLYYDDDGQLWGDSTVWVKRFIERTGLSFKDNWDSIPDHITIELELMQRLASHEAELWAQLISTPLDKDKQNLSQQLCQCLDLQEQFLREHLCKWIPKFCKRILETSTSVFYQQMGRLTNLIVLSDVERLTIARDVVQL